MSQTRLRLHFNHSETGQKGRATGRDGKKYKDGVTRMVCEKETKKKKKMRMEDYYYIIL